MGDDAAIVELTSRFAEFAQQTDERLKRIESGIVGDEALGHEGMGRRLARVDRERQEGDKRLHQRIDLAEDEIARVDRKNDTRWNRVLWVTIGASIASAGGAAGIVQAIAR